MPNITLNCLVLGEDPEDNVFDVDIGNGKSVNKLKEAIKEKRSNTFDGIDAALIQLWKVDIPLDTPNDELTALQGDIADLSIEDDLQGTKLHPARFISFYFANQPAAMRISVVIQKPTAAEPPLDNYSARTSMSAHAQYIKEHSDFQGDIDDLSFLEELTRNETRRVKAIYDQIQQDDDDPDPAWTDVIREVQPWMQDLYEKLAGIFQLTVNWDDRVGGGLDEIYADHYLTRSEWSRFCNKRCPEIDYARCWGLEDKAAWQASHKDSALVQCFRYSQRFFQSGRNDTSICVSIITDARNYSLWYVYFDGSMKCHQTVDYEWNQDTMNILGRVFKTFKKADILRASASPRDFGNLGARKDISAMGPAIRPPNFFSDQRVRNKALYDAVMERAKKSSPLDLSIVTTNIGDIKVRRLLGTGSDTVVFEGLTADNERVAIKYSFGSYLLRREAGTLKKLNEVECIPKLLHEDFNGRIPYIVTSMVGRKATKIDALIACNIIIDILEVLKSIHDHHYIHNDIQPGNIVKVGDKFRLIDFGLAVQRCNKRETAPLGWPMGHIIFASHNWGKYLGAGDDLEALCYTVAFMHDRNKVYWRAATRDPFKALHEKKEVSNVLHLFDGLPSVFWEFFCYVYNLDIAATPDYECWHKQFTSTVSDLPSLSKKRVPETSLGSSEGKSSQRARKFDDRSINTC